MTKPIVMTPDEFRAWRDRLGWTRQRAADELGYKLTVIARLEQGVMRVTERVQRLTAALEHIHDLEQRFGIANTRKADAEAMRKRQEEKAEAYHRNLDAKIKTDDEAKRRWRQRND